jgi:cellulose synthase/poly-beta-1,6-N-acetylglucosamine synthase-like glycosyltransferase
MKTLAFIIMAVVAAFWLAQRRRLPPSRAYGTVDAIVPAHNEQACIIDAVEGLLKNRYIHRVIVVNDGSTDRTAAILDLLAVKYPQLLIVHQPNTGKGGALMAGVARSQAPYVLLTDADTIVPADGDGIGYLVAEIERGADAVGGIPASNLMGAGLLPHIRATVKLPMIALKRTFQQLVGGAPFLISGACGLFRTEVLRQVPFSDRTKVEDLDMTWSLVEQGYKVKQSSRCVVYSQECNSLRSEWLRWRRWIIGYAVCMRLHHKLLWSRYGLFSILPMFLVVLIGLSAYATALLSSLMNHQVQSLHFALFPVLWLLISFVIGAVSAIHHRKPMLIALAPTAVFYVILAYAIWLVHGLRSLVTGWEPQRDKPLRYAHVVE